MLVNTTNQPSKFRTKILFKVNDDACQTYSTNSQIKFKVTRSKFTLWDSSSECILIKGTVTITGTEGETGARW